MVHVRVRGTNPTLSMNGHRPSISVLATSLPGKGLVGWRPDGRVRSGGAAGGGDGVEVEEVGAHCFKHALVQPRRGSIIKVNDFFKHDPPSCPTVLRSHPKPFYHIRTIKSINVY